LALNAINYHSISNVKVGDVVLLSVSSNISSGYGVGFQSAILFSNLTTVDSRVVSYSTYPGNPHVYQFVAKVAGSYYFEVYGATSVLSYTVTASHQVSGLVPAPVQAYFSYSAYVTPPMPGTTIYFTDQSLGTPTSWQWNFGDGLSSTLQSPTHNYTSAEDYDITLTVTNAAGSTSSLTKQIHVAPAPTPTPSPKPVTPVMPVGNPPHADFSVNLQTALVHDPVSFQDLSTGIPTSWHWDFGDGTTSTEQNPMHSYERVGTYTVKLTVSNTYGDDTTIKQDLLKINPFVKPIAKFEIDGVTISNGPINAVTGHFLQFHDLSENTATSWFWDFGDGSTSTEQNPTHSYAQEGNYTVILTASNSAGNDVIRIENCVSVTSNEFKFILSSPVNFTLRILVILITGGVVLSVVKSSKPSKSK
jgi:PKD repeat protein